MTALRALFVGGSGIIRSASTRLAVEQDRAHAAQPGHHDPRGPGRRRARVRRRPGLVPDFVCTIPFERGAQEIVDWHDADPSHRVVDPHHDALMDALVARWRVGG